MENLNDTVENELNASATESVVREPKAPRRGFATVALDEPIVSYYKEQEKATGMKWSALVKQTLKRAISRGIRFDLAASEGA